VIGFARGSVKRLGSLAELQALKPATRNGLGSIAWELLTNAKQQIAQGGQGSPSFQVVEMAAMIKSMEWLIIVMIAAMISVMFAILNVKAAHAHRMKGWEIRQSGTPPCTWSIASKCKRGIRPWARH
jgi:hypothetical protein